MAQPKESAIQEFICSCQNEPLSKLQIIDHLSLRDTHNITKIAPPQSSKDLKNSILNKIANIAKTQLQIQAFSNQLIQTITQNTSDIIQKLSNTIRLYKQLILNPPKFDEIINIGVINTFKLNPPLFTALNKHFGQQLLAQKSTFEAIARNAKTQVIDIRRNHVGPLDCMAVFSDEKRVITGGGDGAVRIWDLETKSQICFILKHKGPILSLALGNTEDLVLTGSWDKSVRLWNVNLKFQIHKFIGHSEIVYSVLISQDQRTGFSGSADKTVRSWNLKLLTSQRTISFQFYITQICLIRDEKIIVACGGEGFVSFFYFEGKKYSNIKSNHNYYIKSICFTPNEEQFITGSDDGTVEVWLTNGRKSHFIQKEHSGRIISIKISTCSKLFATASYFTVIIWDFIKLYTIRSITISSYFASLYFVKNSSSLLIGSTAGINEYILNTFVNEEKIKKKVVGLIVISPDMKYSAYGLFCVRLIDIETKLKVSKKSNIIKNANCLKFSPDSALVAVGCDKGEIIILSIPNLVQLDTLYTKLSRIECLSFSQSNELIGFCDLKSVQVWLIKTKKILYESKVLAVKSVCFCSNDEKFIYSNGGEIYVLTESFSLVTKIIFGVQIFELFVNEDNSFVLMRHANDRWSILKAESLKKICEDESKKFVKVWCTRRQDLALRTHLSLKFLIY